MTVTVRPMSPDEIAAYRSSAVDALAVHHVGRGLSPEQGRDAALAELARDLDGDVLRRRTALLVVESGEASVGSVRLSDRDPWGGQAGWIADLRMTAAVDGLTGDALRAVEDVLRAWGRVRVGIAVRGDDEETRARYQGAGYRMTSQRMVKRLGRHAARELPDVLSTRPLRDEEFPDWLDLVRRTLADDLVRSRTLEPPAAEGKVTADTERLLADGPATAGTALRVLEHAGRPVGTVWVSETSPDGHPRRGWLHHIHVAEGHRRKGFGRAAMLVAEQTVLAVGHRGIGLELFATNTAALGLYEALGYNVEVAYLVKTF